MKKEKISDVIGMIDEKYTDEATSFAADTIEKGRSYAAVSKIRARRVRWGILAACLALIFVTSSAAVAFAAEAKEYSNAVAFFEENGLSTGGLTRAEIKDVYRDITTQKFTYVKTVDVIKRSVLGYEILQSEPTPEELASLWNKNAKDVVIKEKGYDYRAKSVYKYNEINGQKVYDGFDKSILECYHDGNLVWQAEIGDFYISDAVHTSAGTAVWGQSYFTSSYTSLNAWIARVGEDGNVIWKNMIDHDFGSEMIASVIDNGDGTWAVVSRGDGTSLCLSQFDTDGNELSSKTIDVGNFGVGCAVKLGDGYLVQLGNVLGNVRHTERLIKLDRDGNVLDSFTYGEDDVDYYITDMAEFGGKIYLSSYAVPTQADGGGRHEIANILSYIGKTHKDDLFGVTDEELTPIVRDNYTAVLLVCDTESGEPTTFYSVTSSLGAELQAADGRLEWNVQTIVNAFFSPVTSSFTIGGACKVFKYTFDLSGVLIEQKDTGETVSYRR